MINLSEKRKDQEMLLKQRIASEKNNKEKFSAAIMMFIFQLNRNQREDLIGRIVLKVLNEFSLWVKATIKFKVQ